ncbi:hypothetical protein IC617_14390 [Neiella sp. HB171785]|uniref:Transglutaminase domain-containing protein n=1 Tax=Neiella litorisoli TaxID=2771431 RepID=A0A8J6QJZ5_9GAMM|nr:hypothetical protein [Neiella litorisoli]MBD1390623.1 hypothetical protein [Neiella litorisoli]
MSVHQINLRLMLSLFLLVGAFSALCQAAPQEPPQIEFNKIPQGDQTLYSYVWKDARGNQQYVKASLDTEQMMNSSRVHYQFKPRHLSAYLEQAIRRAEADLPAGVNMRLSNSGYSYAVRLTGRDNDDVAAARAQLNQVIADAEAQYLDDRNLAKLQDGYGQHGVIPNHLFYASASLQPLAPLITAFYKQVHQLPPHIALERIISFVQAIPYNDLERLSGGYLPPPSVINENMGDCDSKAALAIALIRGVYPRRKIALVYLKEHALLAAQFNYDVQGDWFYGDGSRWLPMEVAGPGIFPVGKASPQSEREIKAKAFRLMPVP